MLDGREPTEPRAKKLEVRVDALRWRQVRAVCRRLTGRELTDVECLSMMTEHYLMHQGLHTRHAHRGP